MPIPSYPENRREEYLNNIATGSGEIPPHPENREEQYLDAIAKNGGGGGSGGGVLVVHMDAQTGALDKTWQEIHDVDFAVIKAPVGGGGADMFIYIVSVTQTGENAFTVMGFLYIGSINMAEFVATSADGYPVAQQGG